MSVFEQSDRIAELSAALGMSIGYLERMSQSKLRDPESHRKMLDRLNQALIGAPKVDLATAIIEAAEAGCVRAAELVEKRSASLSDEDRKKDYAALAEDVRNVFKKRKD